jgi:sucrose phosphorylase
VYYVGALAGKNDEETLAKTGIGRDINRHNYTLEEIATECRRDVVKRLFALMRFRNSYPAFDGEFSMIPCDAKRLHWRWMLGEYVCELHANLQTYEAYIAYRDEQLGEMKTMPLCDDLKQDV